uniref:Spt6 SH2 domain-containing protein n=1 Tax=Biomphalaria glabrata TaxID=6526 RepID=A0A2C9LNX9_BIOGL
MPRNVARHEYVSVTPDGIKYRNQIFKSVNSLIRWFKEHFRDPIPGTPSSRTPAMSTYTTPGAHQTPGRTPVGRTPVSVYGHRIATPHGTTPRSVPTITPQRGLGGYGGFQDGLCTF